MEQDALAPATAMLRSPPTSQQRIGDQHSPCCFIPLLRFALFSWDWGYSWSACHAHCLPCARLRNLDKTTTGQRGGSERQQRSTVLACSLYGLFLRPSSDSTLISASFERQLAMMNRPTNGQWQSRGTKRDCSPCLSWACSPLSVVQNFRRDST